MLSGNAVEDVLSKEQDPYRSMERDQALSTCLKPTLDVIHTGISMGNWTPLSLICTKK